jgi:hypothetical protein
MPPKPWVNTIIPFRPEYIIRQRYFQCLLCTLLDFYSILSLRYLRSFLTLHIFRMCRPVQMRLSW